jgi:hypothetical protein
MRPAALAAICIATLAAPASVSGSPGASASLNKGGEYARDCIGNASLRAGRANQVRFVVWCSVQSGKVRLTIRRDHGAPILGYPSLLRPSGPGARGAFRCRRVHQTIKCAGRAHGPLTLHGTVLVAPASRCQRVFLHTAGTRFQTAPIRCPGVRAPRLQIDWGAFRGFRRGLGLDYDIRGDGAAIDRRIRSAIVAWRRGEPVARVTATSFGIPLTPVEMRRFEFREELLDRTAEALERWVPRHAVESYAGYTIDISGPVIIRVGFTGDQAVRLAEFKRQVELFAPQRVQGFLVPPTYSESQLHQYEEGILGSFDSPIGHLLTSMGTNDEANKVEIGTEHVAKMKRLLLGEFGTLDPFLVVFERPGTFL